MISLKEVISSNRFFTFIISLMPICLFLPAGFISLSIILFLITCLFSLANFSLTSFASNRKTSQLLYLPILLYLLYLIGASYSDSESLSSLLVRRVPILIIPVGFILLRTKIGPKEADIILGSFLLLCLLSSLICYSSAVYNIIKNQSIIYPYSDNNHSYYFAYNALTKPIKIDPIYLSMFCNMATVIGATTPLIKTPGLRSVLIIYLGVFILFMASKVGILTFGILFLLWLFKNQLKKSTVIMLIVALLPVLWIGIYKFPFLKERFKVTTVDYSEPDSGKWGSIAFRLAIWSSAIEASKEHLIVGHGTGGGENALLKKYREKNFFRGYTDNYNAHNEFLSTQLDLGLIGLTFLCIMIALPFILVKDNLTRLFLLIAVLTFLVESIFFRQRGIVFFSFFYSFLIWRYSIVGAGMDNQTSILKEKRI